jgi:hypothetical protein
MPSKKRSRFTPKSNNCAFLFVILYFIVVLRFMKHFSLVVIFTSLFFMSNAQIIVDKTVYSLGEVEKSDDKYVDFKFTNASSAPIEILKADLPYGVSVRFSSKKIPPDSTVLVRVKYTPKRKGQFSADVPIWVSSNNKPITLTVNGKALSYNSKETIEAPDFINANTETQEKDELRIKVVERATQLPIANAKIDIIWDGVVYKTLYTDNQGMARKGLKKDVYYIIATAKAYGATEIDYDYSNDEAFLHLELGPEGEQLAVQEPVLKLDSGQALQDEEIAAIPKDTVKIESEVTEVIVDEPNGELITPISKELPEDRYSSNNIVFLIDISVSMKQKGKLDLLKASMIELTKLLRDNDKVAIVTYSSKTNIRLRSTYVNDKERIIEVIKALEASGSTAGAKGVKRAYAVLNNNRIASGNNQIFISTDGAFNLEKKDKKLLKIVRKNSKRGNKISVIGIKNPTWTVKNMKQIAASGKGNYIHIENFEKAKSSLIEEVKKQSIKR